MRDTPRWLADALRRYRPWTPPVDRPPQLHDIRTIEPHPEDPTAEPRLAVVVAFEEEPDTATVALLHNELEMATDADVTLPRNTTGAPCDLVAQTDLAAPVDRAQLGRLFATVPATVDLACRRDTRRGLPIRGRTDPRWPFKESELAALQRLAAPTFRRIMGDT